MSNRKIHPPRFADRFLKWFCADKVLETLQGDLYELYEKGRERHGKLWADFYFVTGVISACRPFAFRRMNIRSNSNYTTMFQHYFKISWRNLLRNKAYSLINIGGLAIGLATCFVITLFVVDELSFDRYNVKADRMVRVVLRGNVNGEEIKEAVTPAPVAPTLEREFPEVEEATRLRRRGSPKVTYKGNTYRSSKLAFVDPNFFEVFTLPLIKGDPKTALSEPNTIILTQSEVLKYFGTEDPLNKTLDIEEMGGPYKVTGVIAKVPANSHFHFDLFASMEGLENAKETNWMASNYFSYLVLSESAELKELEKKLPAIVEKYMGPQISRMGISFEEFKNNGNEIGIFFQPLTDIHLHSDSASPTELETGGDIKTVFILGAVALFMLLIACINFMNISTASATKRMKEIGIKKVLGSRREQLVYQFLTESFISTTTALLLAMLTAIVALPLFNQLSGKTLEAGFLLSPKVLVILIFLVLLISLCAGSYPAFLLSSFKPIAALKSKMFNGGRKSGIRSLLVVFQFVISIGLILSTLVVDQQMSFIQSKDIGYDREQLIVVRESYLLGNNEKAFKNELESDPRIENVTTSAFIPAGPTDNNMTSVYPGQQKESFRRSVVYNIDEAYIPTMGMTVVEGRNFSEEFGSGGGQVIINETAKNAFGLEDDPIGQLLTIDVGGGSKAKQLTVIGVVKDFHFRSMHEVVNPVIMLYNPYGGIIMRVKAGVDIAGVLNSAESKWKSLDAKEPFSYAFLDSLYNETYLDEQKMGVILRIFAVLTILVACLGLFGLVTFTAEQRIKEVGVRKVLGASVVQIVALLSKDFLKLVIVAILIALPLAYYLMLKWLQGFAYRVEIQWWVFALAGVVAVAIAIVTVSFQAIRAAIANPIDSLRTE